MTEVIVALFVFRRLGPVQEIRLLALGLLREQVVGEPHGELTLFAQFLDDGIILRIVLKAAACVDGAGHAETVELAHECRVEFT